MTEENSNSSLQTHPSSEPQSSFRRSLSLFIAFIAMLVAALSAWQGYVSFRQLNTQLALVDEAKQLSQTNRSRLTQLQQQTRRLQAELNALNQQNSSNQAILSQAADWIRAAQMSQLLHNTSHAIQYLQLADQTVTGLNNPQFQPIHNAINQDLENLKTTATTDQEALIIKLDNLSQGILQLPTLFNAVKSNTTNSASVPVPNPYESSNWRQKLLQTLAYLKGFVIIKHNTQLPLLTPQQQDLLRMSLVFKLMQSQWAVMQLNDALYQRNLALIQELLQNYFTYSAEETIILSQLKELQQIHLQNNSMLINNSLTVIMSYLKVGNINSVTTKPPGPTPLQPPASTPNSNSPQIAPHPLRPSLRDSVEA